MHLTSKRIYFVPNSSMKFGKLTALALAGALTFAACKYEEGPRMSLRSKRDRVSNEWKVVKLTSNDSNIIASVNPTYQYFDVQLEDTVTYNFQWVLNLMRTGAYTCELLLVTKDANGNESYISNLSAHGPDNAGNERAGFTWLPGMSAAFILSTVSNLPAPYKYIRPNGKWSFDKGHYKIQVKPDLGYVYNENGTGKNTLDWTIVKLAEKAMKLKGLDENDKPWAMELKSINKENYFY